MKICLRDKPENLNLPTQTPVTKMSVILSGFMRIHFIHERNMPNNNFGTEFAILFMSIRYHLLIILTSIEGL